MKTLKENFKKIKETTVSVNQRKMVENLKSSGLLKIPENTLVYGPDIQKLAFSNSLNSYSNYK